MATLGSNYLGIDFPADFKCFHDLLGSLMEYQLLLADSNNSISRGIFRYMTDNYDFCLSYVEIFQCKSVVLKEIAECILTCNQVDAIHILKGYALEYCLKASYDIKAGVKHA